MDSLDKKVLISLGLACLGILVLFSLSQRPPLDYFLFEYIVLHSLKDQHTGKVIELGVLSNFGSTEYEVGVYDDVNNERSVYGLRKQNISVVGYPGPVPELIQFDGKCYFLTLTRWRKDWDKINPIWRDRANGKEICFYVLISSSQRIDS
jgi:hypothetical protein